MKEMFKSKLDELTETFDSKISFLKEEISADLNTERLRLDQLVNSVKTLKNEVLSIKESVQSNELTIVAFGLQYDREEIIEEKEKRLIVALGQQVSENVKITHVSRLNTKKGKPGIVKFSLENVDQKILVLRNKMKLRKSVYSDVYLTRAKSFIEIQMEQNSREMILRLPNNTDLRVNSNGRIFQKKMNAAEGSDS
ncbi:hypothetical protein SNE40_003895 [Patella caerulea]|uniref:Uncharacterized protein n=1 Tax=Patella caerulea TaxID=87958 RepID=A0AAN8QFW5_PATCE